MESWYDATAYSFLSSKYGLINNIEVKQFPIGNLLPHVSTMYEGNCLLGQVPVEG